MAALPTIKQVTREDLSDAPSWIEKLLTPLNQFMQSVYSALSGNLTFGANIRGSIRTLRFNTSATYVASKTFPELEFPTGLPVKATGCLLLQLNESTDAQAVVSGGVSVNWVESSGRINVKYISGLEDSKKYVATFLVI